MSSEVSHVLIRSMGRGGRGGGGRPAIFHLLVIDLLFELVIAQAEQRRRMLHVRAVDRNAWQDDQNMEFTQNFQLTTDAKNYNSNNL